jgi:medium-chain acyl-[acyl-carrier-protein] hydrolase
MDRPAVFFGHSMGALIAFELARTLRRQRCPGPAQLILSGASAPQVRHPLRELVHKATHDDLVARLRRLSGTPQAVLENQELMQIVVPILRADFAVDETYQYCDEPPLDTPFTVFGGLDDPEVDELGLRAWRGLTTGTFSLHLVEGDHFFVNDSLPLLRLLSTEIRHLAAMTSGEHPTFSLAGGTP